MLTLLREKFITMEDPMHIHKFFGIYCLLNYIVQFYHYFTYRSMVLNVCTILPHICLHMSSFIFKVLQKRPVTEENKIVSKMSMFIWEELRIHSLVFGSRSCLIILFPEQAYTILIGTMIMADMASYTFGIPNVTTVRGNNNVKKNSFIKKMYACFFSTSQMGATILCGGFFQQGFIPNPILVFSTLPAIQTSAFGMTLMRKNIISKTTWQFVYSIELALVYIIWYMEYGNFNIVFYSLLAYLLRTNGINKYVLWLLYMLVHNYTYNRRFLIE